MQALSNPRLWRASTALLALATCGAASAASVQYDFTHATSSTTWFDTPSLTKFDSSLGTLQSVDFFLGGNMVTQAELNNKSNNSGTTVTNTTIGHYSIFGTGSDTSTYFDAGSNPYTTQAVLGVGDGSANYVAPHGVILSPSTLAFTSTASHYTDSSTLARFTGTGSIGLMFYASAVSNGTGSSNFNVGNQTTANGVGYVRYNYAPVPEPASFGALAIGAAAFLRRRKMGAR